MPQPDREDANPDLDKAEWRFAHANNAAMHVSPNIGRCSLMNIFIPVNFLFYILIWSLSWNRARTVSKPLNWLLCHPHPVTGEATLSPIYITPLAPEALGGSIPASGTIPGAVRELRGSPAGGRQQC